MTPIPVTPEQTACLLRDKALVVDLRSSVAFYQAHVVGAINLQLSGLLSRRLQRGRIKSLDHLFTDSANLAAFRNRHQGRSIIVCDEHGDPTANTCLGAFLKGLADEGLTPYYIEGSSYWVDSAALLPSFSSCDTLGHLGGFGQFQSKFRSLCACCPMPNGAGLTFPFAMNAPRSPETLGNERPSFILENLVMGRKEDASNIIWLRENGVTHILNVCHEPPIEEAKELCQVKHFPLSDHSHENILGALPEAIAFIGECTHNTRGGG